MIFSHGKTPADMVGRRMFQSTTTKVHNDARQPPKEEITQKRISKQGAMKGVQLTIQVPGFLRCWCRRRGKRTDTSIRQ